MKFIVAITTTTIQLVVVDAEDKKEAIDLAQSGCGDGKDVATTHWNALVAESKN